MKEQAYIDYFYGKDGVIEDTLKEIEDHTSCVFRKIIEEIKTPVYHSEEHSIILAFIMFLSARTKFSADATDDFMDKTIKTIYQHDPRLKEYLNEVNVKLNNPAAFALSSTAKILPIVFDLHFILVHNATKIKFITSDNPVVKYNQFLEHRNTFGSNVGLSTRGLQIFFPLTPELYLLFYDIAIYKIGSRGQRVIIVNDNSDVDELNKLQVVNGNNNLFFNEHINEKYVEKLISQSKKFLRTETSKVKEIPLHQDSNGGHSLLVGQQEDIKKNLQLSFIKETKQAKKYDVIKEYPNMRNEELVKAVMGKKI